MYEKYIELKIGNKFIYTVNKYDDDSWFCLCWCFELICSKGIVFGVFAGLFYSC